MRVTILTIALLILTLVGTASAQFEQHPNDLGEADTVDYEFTVFPDFTTGQMQFQMDLYMFTDSNLVRGITVGFNWDNPNVQMDSATSPPEIVTAFDLGRWYYEDGDISLTNANQRFLFGAALMSSSGLQPAPDRQLLASYYFTLSAWDIQDSIVIDTGQFNGGSEWAVVTEGDELYLPWLRPRLVEYDSAWTPPSNLTLIPDSLHFEAVYGGGDPASQTFDIGSTGDPLSFNIIESVGWIVPSPIAGTTPRAISVGINTWSLAPGLYVDSMRVEAGDAGNSPQWMVVSLDLVEPPPAIAVTPSEVFFSAITGGDDPASRFITITNVGGMTLEWTVSNSESWLSLSPPSGVDSGDVELIVSITGLPFGEYYDTVFVTDPDASNSPVGVPVTLTLGSDLPVIEVDSAYNYVVVPVEEISIPPVEILVRNGGIGTMNFWIEESSPRISSVTPPSGTAPQLVEVGVDPDSGSSGHDYEDTLWIYSDEAINSPFPVVMLFHFVNEPAIMWTNVDTVVLTTYECGMGFLNPMPTSLLTIMNGGGDDPLNFELSYDSDYFRANPTSGSAYAEVTVRALETGLPLGTYLDSMWVSAPKAYNGSKWVYVKYLVIEGVDPPEILTVEYLVIPTQENAGPEPYMGMFVNNVQAGCMPWELTEDIDWFYPEITEGDVPGEIDVTVNATGFPFGEYLDTAYVSADGAVNDSVTMEILLRVWRFRGDLNYDARINIIDLTYFVRYLFAQGPGPEPERRVGDLNCNKAVNIEDLTYLVQYLFAQGPIPCTNPYKKTKAGPVNLE